MSLSNDRLVVLLAFTGASLAVIASSDAVHPYLRVAAAAIAAGCSATLALLRSPGQVAPPVTREDRVRPLEQAREDRLKEQGRG
jgi:hypothetical protein